MTTYDLVYESCPWFTRVSLFNEHKKLISLHHDFENDVYKEGAVLIGRVRKIVEGLNAAFVDIGDVTDAFLPLKKVPKSMGKLTEGQAVVVRITRERVEGKGATLSANVLHTLPEGSFDVPSVLEDPPAALSRALMDAGASPVRVWIHDARFRLEALKYLPETKVYQLDQHEDVDLVDKLDEELASLPGDEFPLIGGGMLTIERTRALTSIDVDSGSMHMADKENLAFQVNMIAAEEVVRLSRLLNIGGSIIVDFIGMRSNARSAQVVNHMKELFENTDLLKVQVLKMSRFGLLEFNREKVGASLLTELDKPLSIAADIMLRLWRDKPGSRIFRVEARQEIVELLSEKLTPSTAIAYLGRPVEFIVNNNYAVGQYDISSNDVF